MLITLSCSLAGSYRDGYVSLSMMNVSNIAPQKGQYL
jgi:hypothetical protein